MAKKRGHGEGSIYQRKDGRYVAELSIHDAGGKRRRVKRSARTKTAAREKLRELQRQRDNGVQFTSPDATLASYLTRWLEDTVKPAVRATSYEAYECACRVRIIPNIGGMKLTGVTPPVLRKLYTDLAARGLAPQTIGQTHRVLHRAFKQALRDGVIVRNPCDAVDPPRAVTAELQTLSSEEVNVLIDGTRDHSQHGLYVVAVTTGMRLGELLALRWSDVELDNRRLFVRRSLQKNRHGLEFVEPKTSKSRRMVMLAEQAITALREHRQRQIAQRLSIGPEWEDFDLVFPKESGSPQNPDGMAAKFQTVLRQLDLPRLTFHGLRHTCATLLLSAGTHPKIVSELLGHSSITMTLDRYSHVVPAMHSEAASTMERILG